LAKLGLANLPTKPSMKTKEQIEQQNSAIHVALLLGAHYSTQAEQHKLRLPCGIELLLWWDLNNQVQVQCIQGRGYHRCQHPFESSRILARRCQSYVWVIAKDWDQENYPTTK
jgi:hypothetical protein